MQQPEKLYSQEIDKRSGEVKRNGKSEHKTNLFRRRRVIKKRGEFGEIVVPNERMRLNKVNAK